MLPPANSYVEILTYDTMVLEDGNFGRWFDYVSGALKNVISAFMSVLSVLPCKVIRRKTSATEEERPQGKSNHAGPHLKLPASSTIRNNFTVNRLLTLLYFLIAAWTGITWFYKIFSFHSKYSFTNHILNIYDQALPNKRTKTSFLRKLYSNREE